MFFFPPSPHPECVSVSAAHLISCVFARRTLLSSLHGRPCRVKGGCHHFRPCTFHPAVCSTCSARSTCCNGNFPRLLTVGLTIDFFFFFSKRHRNLGKQTLQKDSRTALCSKWEFMSLWLWQRLHQQFIAQPNNQVSVFKIPHSSLSGLDPIVNIFSPDLSECASINMFYFCSCILESFFKIPPLSSVSILAAPPLGLLGIGLGWKIIVSFSLICIPAPFVTSCSRWATVATAINKTFSRLLFLLFTNSYYWRPKVRKNLMAEAYKCPSPGKRT